MHHLQLKTHRESLESPFSRSCGLEPNLIKLDAIPESGRILLRNPENSSG